MHNITDSLFVCCQGEKEQKVELRIPIKWNGTGKTMIVGVVNGNKQVFKGCRVCNFH